MFRKIQQETASQRLNGEMYSPSRSRVINLLANLQQFDDATRPITLKDIARLCALSVRTVIRAINELEADGQLIVRMNYGFNEDGLWVRMANTYKMVKKSLFDLRELLASKVARDRARKKMAENMRKILRKNLSANSGALSSDSQRREENLQQNLDLLDGWSADEMALMRQKHLGT